MNLLLVDPAELASDATCALGDRRARHLREVLGVSVGSRVRAGVVGGGLGTAEILADDGAVMQLRLEIADPEAPPLPIELVLAIPRPKVLTRVVEIAAAFGVNRIDLTNAWRVDKSYLSSPRLTPDALAHAARLGAEQGATTRLPVIAVHRRLMALLDQRGVAPRSEPVKHLEHEVPREFPDPHGSELADDHHRRSGPLGDEDPGRFLDPGSGDANRGSAPRWPMTQVAKLIAHPGAPPIETSVAGPAVPVVLAIGPEGGWITREVETFVARGFSPVSLGAPILRVEAAVAAALGQLLVLRRLAR